MQQKAAIIGNSDFVQPYSVLGIDTFAVSDNTEEIIQAAEKIAAENYAIVIVAENIAQQADRVFQQFRTKPTPCVVVVPFTTESRGFAVESLSRLLKTATGINIFQNT